MTDLHSLSRREFLRTAGLAAAGAALAGCGSLPAPPARPGNPIPLVYQDSRVGWFPPMVQQMLDQFHATHPNIRVFYTPEPESPQDIEEKTLGAMQVGTAPDVFQGCCDWFPIWAQKGYTLDLRPYVSADLDTATIADFNPGQYKYFFTRDGRQYALPKYHGGLALYYNRDVFDQYKVDYPNASWNHDDYLAAMKRLTHDRDGDGKIDLWGSMTYVSWARIQIHVNGWGGHLIDPNDPTKCRMGEPEALAAVAGALFPDPHPNPAWAGRSRDDSGNGSLYALSSSRTRSRRARARRSSTRWRVSSRDDRTHDRRVACGACIACVARAGLGIGRTALSSTLWKCARQ